MVRRVFTLLTDFGTDDAYIGMMKGVILRINPLAQCIDLVHSIPQADVFQAGMVLQQSWQWFPEKSIHICIVDPGVGSHRRALICEYKDHFFIAPDNGVLEPVISNPNAQIHHLASLDYFHKNISRTFHGRDIFAPAAAHLSLGVELNEFGPLITDPVRLVVPEPKINDGIIFGEIVYIDHFGNCLSNISEQLVSNKILKQIKIDNVTVTLADAYADVEPDSPLAIFSSQGRLEIAVRNGNAAELLHIKQGTLVKIYYATS